MRNLHRYSKDYSKYKFENVMAAYRRKNVISLIKKYNTKNILEIGCGLEPFFLFYKQFKEFTVVEPTLKFYRNALIKKKDNVQIYNLSFEDFSAKKANNYNLILISSLIHELEKPKLFIKKLNKFANKSNVIHVNVPNAHSFHRLLAYEMGLIKNVFQRSKMQIKMQQKSVFSLKSLKTLFTEEGFKIIDSGSFFIKPFTHEQMSKVLKIKAFDPKILDGLNKMQKYMPNLGSEIFIDIKKK